MAGTRPPQAPEHQPHRVESARAGRSAEARSAGLGGAARTMRNPTSRARPDEDLVLRVDCAWRLALAHALQTTLDPERGVEIFARHCASIVACDALAFTTAPNAPSRRQKGPDSPPPHCIALMLEGRRLGTLAFTRRRPFEPDELRALAAMSADLARPLANALRHREACEAAIRDPLTGAANRAHLTHLLECEIDLVRRHGGTLALLMIDVDRFKHFNDRFGHPAGDRCLSAIAACVSQRIRRSDLLSRYGGEEFCVLLPRTGEGGARRLAEGIRAAVDALRVPAGDGRARVSVSLGVAAFAPGDRPSSLIARADAALYRAKRSGRNRVSGPAGASRIPPAASRTRRVLDR